MNLTKVELAEALLQARIALSKDIRDFLKYRNGFLGNHYRKNIREKIAAYRLLSNLDTISAQTYTFDKRALGKMKKALAN
jgi:hypothetical protein